MSNIVSALKTLPIPGNYEKVFSVIDSHTAGEPARVIVDGLPDIPGKTMAEKKAYIVEHYDHYRTALMFEPRGHNDMFGAFLLPTTVEEADIGIVFMDGGGYLNMCGHNTIAAVAIVLEAGIVLRKEEGATETVILETPAGLVKAIATFDDCGKRVKEVSFDNVESFLYKENQKINLPGVGEITFDISFGGSFFAILHADELGLKIVPENASKLSDLCMQIMGLVNEQIEIQHPTLPHIKTVDLVEVYDDPTHPEATYKNVVVFGEGQVDRSPCGTGTSAKMATLYARDQLKVGETFVYESILGTLFRGEIVKETEVAGIKAIVPNVTGSAYITGFTNFVLDAKDPVKNGFKLK